MKRNTLSNDSRQLSEVTISTHRVQHETLDKKDFKVEQEGIRPFSLMFDDVETEKQWNQANLARHIGLTSRYLFVAACFQGIFYWGDYIESSAGINAKSSMDKFSNIAFIGLIRLILGIMTLCACFLVSTGLLVPTQGIIWMLNICYGIPTLSLFYFARAVPSHWDCLFLIYGLAFFMLPKISPLNFVFGIIGATVLCVIFLYISSFRLSFQQWLLSSCVLLMITSLFSYMCYCSEKLSREKWLLHVRLQQEKINFRVVSSLSITDDFNRAVSESGDPFEVSLNQSNNNNNSVMSFLADTLTGLAKKSTPSSSSVSATKVNNGSDESVFSENCYNEMTTTSAVVTGKETHDNKNKRMAKFYRGVLAWALCYSMAYAFDMEEVNKSAAFALLMHTMGFSIFLVVLTEQIRWLALNGTVGLTMLWALNQVGVEQRWVVFSAHSIGYVVLVGVVVVMILVFGGVVFVWSHLLDFIKDILVKYPQVKSDLSLSEDRVLEHLMCTYLADLPKSALGSEGQERVHTLEMFKADEEHGPKASANNGNKDEQSYSVAKRSIGKQKKSITECPRPVDVHSVGKGSSYEAAEKRPILSPRKANCCYFCLSPNSSFLVPACSAWDNRQTTSDAKSGSGASSRKTQQQSKNEGGIRMCTPYTTAITQRDELSAQVATLETELMRVRTEMEVSAFRAACEHRDAMSLAVAAERRKYEAEVQAVITDHNRQLSELKRLYRAYKLQNQKQLQPHQDVESGAASLAIETADDTSTQPVLSKGSNSGSNSGRRGSKSQVAVRSTTDVGINTAKVPPISISVGNSSKVRRNSQKAEPASASSSSSTAASLSHQHLRSFVEAQEQQPRSILPCTESEAVNESFDSGSGSGGFVYSDRDILSPPATSLVTPIQQSNSADANDAIDFLLDVGDDDDADYAQHLLGALESLLEGVNENEGGHGVLG